MPGKIGKRPTLRCGLLFPLLSPRATARGQGQADRGTRGAGGEREEKQMGCVGCEWHRCSILGEFPGWQAAGERLERGHPGNGPAYLTPVSVQSLTPRGAT